MPSLQMHMLRVAAVASLICDSMDMLVDKDNIIMASLLHDMGNIIKSDLNYFPEFLEPEGLEYWQNVQNEYKKKYGVDEHGANMQVAKKLGVSNQAVELIDSIRFSLVCTHAASKDMHVKILHYADGRVGPYGIVSYIERMEEGKKRYKNHKSTFGSMAEEERVKLVACGKEIERQIFSHCKIKPEDINDETVASIISKLKDFVIK